MLRPGGCSPRLALALSVAALLASLTANYLALGRSFVNTRPQHDSLHYLRDALLVQHRIFDLPGDREVWLRQSFQNYGLSLPSRGIACVMFGNRSGFLFFNVMLLHVFGGSIAAFYFANMVMVALAAAFAAYVLGREVGFVGTSAFIVLLSLCSEGSQIDTIMIEPMFSLVLVMMAFGAWLVLRKSLGGIFFLMIMAILAPLVKGSLMPLALIGAGLCGGILAARYWQKKRLRVIVCAGAVVCSLLTLGLLGLIRTSVLSGLDDPDERRFNRSNAGYALWMGSLPTSWTGAYSGRIDTETFKFGIAGGCNPVFKRQWQQIKQYAEQDDTIFYYVKVGDVLPLVKDNYNIYPMDALARIAFRYTKMIGINGLQINVHVLTAGLALFGCVVIALGRHVTMVPWLIALQGILWVHTLSRYRPRDDAQIVVLVPFLASVGLVWLLCRVFRVRPWSEQSPSTPRRLGWSLVAVVSFPLLLALLFPETQSLKPSRVIQLSYVITEGEDSRLKVGARLEEPYTFARLRLSGERSGVLDQADKEGWVSFDVPWNKGGQVDLSRGDSFKIMTWSRTGIKHTEEIIVDCERTQVEETQR
jgi:hypothetical protein